MGCHGRRLSLTAVAPPSGASLGDVVDGVSTTEVSSLSDLRFALITFRIFNQNSISMSRTALVRFSNPVTKGFLHLLYIGSVLKGLLVFKAVSVSSVFSVTSSST